LASRRVCRLGFAMLFASAGVDRHVASGHTVRAAHTVGRCASSQLMIQPLSPEPAAMGHVGRFYRIHNTRRHACSVEGYPGIRLVDRHLLIVKMAVFQGQSYLFRLPHPRTVLLTPHQDAYFAMEYGNNPVGNQRTCPDVRYLLGVLPGFDHSVRTSVSAGGAGIHPCGLGVTVSRIASSLRAFAFQP